MRRLVLVLSLLLLSVAPTSAESEREACKRLAPKYKAASEVVLSDGSRPDLVSDEYAFEVDWPSKWKEAVGQSLLYAMLTGKRPAIILLVSGSEADSRYIGRCEKVCNSVWMFYAPGKRPECIELFLEPVASPPEPTLAPPKPQSTPPAPSPTSPWKNEGGRKWFRFLVDHASK